MAEALTGIPSVMVQKTADSNIQRYICMHNLRFLVFGIIPANNIFQSFLVNQSALHYE
jgi:hypothetical protein